MSVLLRGKAILYKERQKFVTSTPNNGYSLTCHAREPAGNHVIQCDTFLLYTDFLRLWLSPEICRASSCAGYPPELSLMSLKGDYSGKGKERKRVLVSAFRGSLAEAKKVTKPNPPRYAVIGNALEYGLISFQNKPAWQGFHPFHHVDSGCSKYPERLPHREEF
eukprot:scaffold194615_cov18-Tisochrysis_lutea.AAC.1